jgi:hypothetical protein
MLTTSHCGALYRCVKRMIHEERVYGVEGNVLFRKHYFVMLLKAPNRTKRIRRTANRAVVANLLNTTCQKSPFFPPRAP